MGHDDRTCRPGRASTLMMRGVVSAIALVTMLGSDRAAAEIDVTGHWLVTYTETGGIGGSYQVGAVLTQTNGAVTVTPEPPGAAFGGMMSYPDGGTIDPDSGALHFEREPFCSPDTEPPVILDAVVASTSASFTGTYSEQWVSGFTCIRSTGTIEAVRLLDSCGNGTVDFGETCDGGACCTEFCRLRDPGSACTGSGGCAEAACDALGACVDSPTCDACVGEPLEMVRLRVGRFGASAGKDFLTLAARVRLPSGGALPDPSGTSQQIVLRDALGNPVVEATLAGGDGWRRKGQRWVYANPGAGTGEVSKMTIAPVGKDPDAWSVKVALAQLALDGTPNLPPLSLLVDLDATAAASTSCGERSFGGPATPAPHCVGPTGKGVVRCR